MKMAWVLLAAVALQARAGNVHELTGKNAGETVAMQPGDQILLYLAGNPTTGYLWRLDSISADSLKCVSGPDYEATPNPERMVGRGGAFITRLEAVKPGTAVVRFSYARPWEKDIPPVEQFSCTAKIEGAEGKSPATPVLAARPREPIRVELWPKGTAGLDPDLKPTGRSEGALCNIGVPWMEAWIPARERNTGGAVIICPGGGYAILSALHEGEKIARKFQQAGVAAFVLYYRLPSTKGRDFRYPVPLADAQQAVRIVRSRAAEWGVRGDRIGVCGFSAGGHLAALAGTRFDTPVHADPVSCRPDFMILVYPVIDIAAKGASGSSGSNLFGRGATEEVVKSGSPALLVGKNTPPAFLAHAEDDTVVPPAHSKRMAEALSQAGVRAELKLYPEGGHGHGFHDKDQPSARWFDDAMNWLERLARHWDAVARGNAMQKDAANPPSADAKARE